MKDYDGSCRGIDTELYLGFVGGQELIYPIVKRSIARLTIDVQQNTFILIQSVFFLLTAIRAYARPPRGRRTGAGRFSRAPGMAHWRASANHRAVVAWW